MSEPAPRWWRAARAYGQTALMALTGQVGESPLFLADYVLRFARVAVLLSIWRTLFAGSDRVGGLTLAAVLTYTLIAEVFADQLAVRSDLDNALWQGSIATRYLRPLGLAGQFAAEMVGRWGPGLPLCSLPLLLAAPWLGVEPWPAGPGALVLFPASLALAIVVGLALDFIFGALTVALNQGPFTINSVRGAISTVLSGWLLPLPLLPWGLGEVFAWLPFAATAAAPLQIYTGTGEPVRLLALQLVWAVLLWLLANWLWRAQRERLTIYGG